MYGIKTTSTLLDMMISLTANLVANKEEAFQSTHVRGIGVPETLLDPSTFANSVKLGSPVEMFLQTGKINEV